MSLIAFTTKRQQAGCTGKLFAWLSWSVVLICLAQNSYAQRNFTLGIAGANQNNVVVSWTAHSATPNGDLVLVPQFRVERSADMKTWTPISAKLTASLNQFLTLTDTNATTAFYRVQSLI